MVGVHDIFHVSILRKHVWDEEHEALVDYQGLDIYSDTSVEVLPLKIIDVQEKGTRNKRVQLVKVQWSNNDRDITWELESKMLKAYPNLFESI